MNERFEAALRRSDKAELWLALAPALLLLLPAMPYLSWPVIMLLKVPWMMHSHWMMRSLWVVVGWLGCAALALGVARWAKRLGQAQARELLAETDVLLYAMMHDGAGQDSARDKGLLAQDILPGAVEPGPGAYEQRLVRLGTHFDRWCKAVGRRYEPPALRVGLWLSFIPTAAVLGALIALPDSAGIWLLLGLTPLIYQHAAASGLRSGARRALAEFFSENAR